MHAAAPAAAASQAAKHAADSEPAEAAPDAASSLDAEDAHAADQLQEVPGAPAGQGGAGTGDESPEAIYHLQTGTPCDAADAARPEEDYGGSPTTPVDAEDDVASALQVRGPVEDAIPSQTLSLNSSKRLCILQKSAAATDCDCLLVGQAPNLPSTLLCVRAGRAPPCCRRRCSS